MLQHSPTGSSGSSEASASALSVSAPHASGAEMDESRNYLDQNSEEGTGYLLKLIASLESYNAALCNKLARLEMELATLRNPAAHILPGAESTSDTRQTHGWERKLTRNVWGPP